MSNRNYLDTSMPDPSNPDLIGLNLNDVNYYAVPSDADDNGMMIGGYSIGRRLSPDEDIIVETNKGPMPQSMVMRPIFKCMVTGPDAGKVEIIYRGVSYTEAEWDQVRDSLGWPKPKKKE